MNTGENFALGGLQKLTF